MNSRDLDKLTMFRTTQDVCEKYNDIVVTNAAFNAANASFSKKIEEIISAAKAQGKVITGITTDKNVDKDDLVQAAADIAGLVFGYASGANNFTLKEAVDFSFSYIEKLRGDLLVTKAQDIYDSANENLSVLGDTGITVDSLAAYKVKIDKYTKSLPSSRTAISTKSTHTANLEELVREATSILTDQMDKYIVNFNESYPAFVALYWSARIVINLSGGHKKQDTPAKEGTL
jgi:hypothetical protein